jgi:hypothetical protein
VSKDVGLFHQFKIVHTSKEIKQNFFTNPSDAALGALYDGECIQGYDILETPPTRTVVGI